MEESMLYLHSPAKLSLSPSTHRRCALDFSQVRKCKRNKVTTKRENAIAGNSEFEVLEQGEGWETVTGGAKKTRTTYSVEKANNILEKPESLKFPPLLSMVDEGSLKPSSAAAGCDSSASNSDSCPASQPSRRSKKLKVIGGLKSHNIQQTFNAKDHKRDVFEVKTGENLDLEVEKLHQSPFASNCNFLNPEKQDVALVDVQLAVVASPQARDVPFVSLRSESHGIAVLGYPLDVGKVRDASETELLSEESDDRRSRFDQLVWRTSKRTPVCYVSSSLSASIPKNAEARPASKKVGSMFPIREKALLKKGKSGAKLQKNRKQLDKGKSSLKKTCIPVELIFSKILAAVDLG